jgi:hypothetical protein
MQPWTGAGPPPIPAATMALRAPLQREDQVAFFFRFANKPAEWDRDKRNGRMLKNLPVIL